MSTPVRVLSDNGPVRVELARWQGKLVVIKRIRGCSMVVATRLKREAEVVKKLRHPNIVPLLASDGENLVYAYCPGVSLADTVSGGALRLRHAATITLDILRALEYAHSIGVIHCDVKPSNVLLKGERALLTDFGFAKDLALASITSRGMMMGTPNYMAPEQFRGERSDPRIDLYSVGAVLYHLVTGQPPYGNAVIRFLAGDTSITLEPIPVTAAPLAGVLSTSLSRSSDARYPNASAMREDLEHAVKTL